MKRLLTGLKPTGDLTLGNYIGGIKPLIDFQKDPENDIFLFVADLHALTVHQDPVLLRERVKKFVAMYIACGVDPSKMIVYIQSENVYVPAISWILECNTYYGEASRMIQFKEKSKGKENFSIGLLTYPILMAADILYCDADYVPVGIDQKQHVELARDIAERFNKVYGETFKIPEAIVPKVGTKIKDLKNPDKKMSKSEDNPSGVISLFDTKEEIIKKVKGATTDSDNKVYFDEENKPGISNLLNIASVMTGRTIEDLTEEFENAGYGNFKTYVGEVTSNKIAEIQEKYKELLGSKLLEDVLNKGLEVTTKLAKEKYELMRERVGLKESVNFTNLTLFCFIIK